MKKILLVSFIAVCVLSFTLSFAEEAAKATPSEESSAPIEADKIPYDKSPINKLSRGLINASTCLAEVPAGIFKVTRERNPFMGWTLGFAEGMLNSFFRLVTGVVDTATFILPPYDKPLMKPEYALDNAFDKFNEMDGLME